MLSEQDRIRLRHMLDYAQEAVELVKGHTQADLGTDRVLELALVRLIELVGEAATRVSQAAQVQCCGIPSLVVDREYA